MKLQMPAGSRAFALWHFRKGPENEIGLSPSYQTQLYGGDFLCLDHKLLVSLGRTVNIAQQFWGLHRLILLDFKAQTNLLLWYYTME